MTIAAFFVGLVVGVVLTGVFVSRTSHLIIARLPRKERLAWAQKVNAAAQDR